MNLFSSFFPKRKPWTELETLYTSERLKYLCAVLAEQHIPYKVRAALLPIPLHPAAPIGTAAQSLWYLSVHSEDVNRVSHILRQERMR